MSILHLVFTALNNINQRTIGLVSLWHLSAEDMLKSAVIVENKFKNIESEWYGPRSMNDLDLWYSYKLHVLLLVDCITNSYIIDFNSFWKIQCFTFSPYKSIREQPYRKIGRSQPRVIIGTNLVVL